MAELNTVSETLFVPLAGRIQISQQKPNILHDAKALELKSRVPAELLNKGKQSQYTLVASASRAANLDRYIQTFRLRHPDGVIAQIGCGLETAFYRNDDGYAVFYEIDLPEVIEFRREVLGETERDRCIPGSAFELGWIKQIRQDFPTAPVLVVAGGLFYYFEKEAVVTLLRQLKNFGPIETVFDTVNSTGMKFMDGYMKQLGHEDAKMFFYVDNAAELGNELDGVLSADEEPYYRSIPRKGLGLDTKFRMVFSDRFNMVKMVHLKLA
ncbi:O-Methyltransferase involved in polyketide biosynthesis [Slackia heliotrinireducens]|uniref:O-methyltransferase involved in polyketide biosynthesis n=1 Tax=Slackia heliotrinireducens (strain ATCC 29202 / DSM 20476 / NCTC 11029 / RHS 1) TaxID=471855 RepID=C7N1V8_SLAHD|nr:class I SAM-dependent methyltransferase [Slackia heliotrinireducens]ACV23399.1 O-methyltransferase involved in polyketide biosynthesis [Slackia heliotrinireducens DSM 20476]VEH02688.1 O-Methyltransferase involved in polyketide biosynthesis [Slackia heliotrinireducens]